MSNFTDSAITTADGIRLARQRAVVLRLALRSLPVDQAAGILDELVALAEAADDLLHVLDLAADIHARSAVQTGFAGLLEVGPLSDREVN